MSTPSSQQGLGPAASVVEQMGWPPADRRRPMGPLLRVSVSVGITASSSRRITRFFSVSYSAPIRNPCVRLGVQDAWNTHAARARKGGQVTAPASPTVRRRRLAAELRRLRERASLTGDQVAEHMGWSASKVSRLENAHTPPRAPEIRKLLALYGAEDRTADLLELAREAQTSKGWWESYSQTLSPEYATLIGLEAEATATMSWAPLIVPGLLQTSDYAREVTNGLVEGIAPISPAETRRRVEARLARQQVLTRDNPLQFSAILDESVLFRRFGDRTVMQSQIKRLLALSERANITLRILPLDGPHPIGTGAFVLLQFDEVHDVTHRDVVYLEHLTGGRYVEEEEESFTYRRTFARLSDLALDEAKSQKMIASAHDTWR
jgi:transcriptional regulator with XRE-family HTH domain